jgi:hypothetical protein
MGAPVFIAISFSRRAARAATDEVDEVRAHVRGKGGGGGMEG